MASRSRAWDNVVRAAIPALLLMAGLSFVTTLLALTIPVYMMQVYQRVIGSSSSSTLVWLTLMAVLALALLATLDFIRHRVADILGQWVVTRLGMDVVPALVSEGARGEQHSTDGLRDLVDLRTFFGSSTPVHMFEVFWSPLFFAVLFLLHPAYGIVAVVAAIGLVGLALLNHRVTLAPGRLAHQKLGQANLHIALGLRNVEVIESMGLMPRVLRRWLAANRDAQQALDVEQNRSDVVTATSRAWRLVSLIVIVAVGAIIVITQRTAPAHVIAAMILSARALGPFEAVIDRWRACQRAWAAAQRLKGLANEEEPQAGKGLPDPSAMLEVDNVSFTPPERTKPVLRNISFAVAPGEIIVIAGPSGAGKSTLARLIMGLFKATEGRITYGGSNINDWRREDLGPLLGYLPQNVGLFDVTVRENISRLQPADPEAVVAAARRIDLHETIGRLPFGYETLVGESSFVLTGGQRQRVGLARAFFGNPQLIVLDEPDASLDQYGERALLQSLREVRAGGSMVIVVSHRRSIANLADKLLILRDGQVEFFGPPSRDDIAPAQRPRITPVLKLAEAVQPAPAGE